MLVEFNSIIEVIGIKLKNIHYVIFSVNEKATVKVALWVLMRFAYFFFFLLLAAITVVSGVAVDIANFSA